MKNSNTIIYNRIFYFLLCSIGLTYILLEITPSSYGVALANFGLPDTTFLGRPKPIRSDEWSVWTPHLQMAVNNEFQRFYSMPEYNIDLRGFNLLPLEDWMLPFKPFVWGYCNFLSYNWSFNYAGIKPCIKSIYIEQKIYSVDPKYCFK